jgi:transcriptional regulator with XRE-family HTH domain
VPKKVISHAPVVKHVAAHIKAARKQRALSQAELARRAGISLSYLARVELGRSSIGVDMLGRIADAIGVPPDSLLRGVSVTEDSASLKQDIENRLLSVLKFDDDATNRSLLMILNHCFQSLSRQR